MGWRSEVYIAARRSVYYVCTGTVGGQCKPGTRSMMQNQTAYIDSSPGDMYLGRKSLLNGRATVVQHLHPRFRLAEGQPTQRRENARE